jgi:hypothetical protein
MADSVAVFLPGTRQTLTAGGTIAGGDLVTLSAASTVVKASALASTAYIGVAGHDAVNGVKVTVNILKAVFDSIADGTVTAGDQLTTTSTANRQVKTLAAANITGAPPLAADINTAINQSRAVIGMAITTATDNTLVRWVQD